MTESNFFEFLDQQGKCGRRDKTTNTLTFLKYHRLGLDEGNFIAGCCSGAASGPNVEDLAAQCESVQHELKGTKSKHVQASFYWLN